MNCAAAICCAFARQKHVTAICCCGLPTRRARSASRGGLPIPCDCHRKVLSGRPPSPPDRRPVSSEPYDVLSSHEPERRHPATHETSLPASRAIREPALYQHQEGRELVRGARPTPNCAEQNRSALARADSAEWTQKTGAASPAAAARVRRAKARRPGVAGFALAPAAGTRPLRGVSPNRKGNRNPTKRSPSWRNSAMSARSP